MRLLTKTTLYFLAALVPVLVAAGFYLYYQFARELNQKMDEELITEEIQWITYLRNQTGVTSTFVLRTPEILIHPVDAPPAQLPTIETITANDANKNRRLPYRQLTHVVPINGIPYLIKIRRSQEQRTAMVANITRLMLVVFVILFITTLLINWLINQTIWRPFRNSLQKIRNAELQKLEAVKFESSNIAEFNELNEALSQMAAKIHNDYISMKEFTENAAHEMQTPLAVVQSKLELLLQDIDLKNEQVELIMQASDALNRLNKLNQSLLLLAKIENDQFAATEEIKMTTVIEKYLKLFDEVIKEKALQVDKKFNDELSLLIHPLLADSLVSNLIGNAIKYNYEHGKINIEITSNSFMVANTSNLPPISPARVFTRFNRAGSIDSSNGLGLAIVKKICDSHALNINYEVENNYHIFKIYKLK